MYLKQLKIYNFRKFKQMEDGEPGLIVNFNEKFNLIIGENDSGKTAIIDAIRLTLGTMSMENPRITEEDFYSYETKSAEELKIECVFSGLNNKEAGIYLEWLSFDETGEYELLVRLDAKKIKNGLVRNRIERSVKAGPNNTELKLEGNAQELLKSTYLKPLRDAENELRPGIRSRLAQILQGHSSFKTIEGNLHELEQIMADANKRLEDYFDSNNEDNISLKEELVSYLNEFFSKNDNSHNPNFEVTPAKLSSILRKLALTLEDNSSGLGSLNLLFIAAELLLLNDKKPIGPSLTLIEEVEAHLHPQAQLRLIKYLHNTLLEKKTNGQFILTTHSPTLAASVSLENLILVHNNFAYPLSKENTKLNYPDDYKFLERFLDATKSNLFFAKGVILVEGDAENLLIPAIAEAINRPLHKYGISIVNLGSTAFKRYANIFNRSQSWYEKGYPPLKLPVALITDSDIKPYEYYVEEKKDAVYIIRNQQHLNEILNDGNFNENYLFKELDQTTFPNIRDLKQSLSETFDTNVNIIPDEELKLKTLNPMTSEFVSTLESEKVSKLNQKYENDSNLKVYVAKHWTLEYMISLSCMRKLLAIIIHECRYKYPYSSSNKAKLDEILKLIDNPTMNPKIIGYKIFKPINDKIVSKAVIAQLLAEKILNDETIKKLIADDPYLKYIVDAICHVTDAREGSGRDKFE